MDASGRWMHLFPIADATRALEELERRSQQSSTVDATADLFVAAVAHNNVKTPPPGNNVKTATATAGLLNCYLTYTFNIYWRTTTRELVARALCGYVGLWLYSIVQFAPCADPERVLLDFNWAYSDFWSYT